MIEFDKKNNPFRQNLTLVNKTNFDKFRKLIINLDFTTPITLNRTL